MISSYMWQGQDQIPAHLGGGSRGSCSDDFCGCGLSEGFYKTSFLLEWELRPYATLGIVAAKPSWKETPGTQWELLRGSSRIRKFQQPFTDKHVAVIMTAQDHQGYLLLNRWACKAHGLQMAHTQPTPLPPLKPGQSHCFPSIPWPGPRINTMLSKWSLFLTIHQENSIQNVQKYPPHSHHQI